MNEAAAAADAADLGALSNLRAVVLLAGSVRQNTLRRAVGRFLLELPIDAQRCVMDLWHEQLTDTAEQFGLTDVPVRVIVDRATLVPANNRWRGRCGVTFEQDPLDYRGTGGLLRDLAAQYHPDDYLLIVNANQIVVEPMASIVRSLAQLRADVALACHSDNSPTGIMLVRSGCLSSIPELGFVDLNEQALPAIARNHDVRVRRGPHLGGLPIRTLSDYLDALRQYHRYTDGKTRGFTGLRSEDWRATFGIIEPGARVDPSAVVHDSVVLDGGRVEAGGLVVRALVCPGGIVSRDAAATDCLVGPTTPLNGREKD